MAAVFTLKVGDTAPAFSGKCLDPNGQPINTLGATVRFRMRPRIASLRAVIDQPAVWADPTEALASYAWDSADTAIPGLYDAEFHVTYGNGLEETFPNGEYQAVEILPIA